MSSTNNNNNERPSAEDVHGNETALARFRALDGPYEMVASNNLQIQLLLQNITSDDRRTSFEAMEQLCGLVYGGNTQNQSMRAKVRHAFGATYLTVALVKWRSVTDIVNLALPTAKFLVRGHDDYKLVLKDTGLLEAAMAALHQHLNGSTPTVFYLSCGLLGEVAIDSNVISVYLVEVLQAHTIIIKAMKRFGGSAGGPFLPAGIAAVDSMLAAYDGSSYEQFVAADAQP